MTRRCDPTPKTVSRRRVLQYGAAGAGLAWLAWRAALAKPDSAQRQAMRKRRIPATGDRLAVMGLGTSGAFSTYGFADMDALRRVLRRFVAMGGQMVDTSPTYGNAETNIGELARETGVRDKLFMATKVDTHGREAGLEQMRGSARKLGKPIDLMQVHNLVDLESQWATLKQLKSQGRFRYIGITHYRTDAFERLEHLMATRTMDFVQFNYSILTPDAEKRLLPLAADRGIAVIVNRAFNDGRFFSLVGNTPLPDYAADFDCHSWAQFALKYVLADPAVNVVIPATAKPKHLEDNMRAGYGALPDKAAQKRMRETMASL